MRGSAGLIRLWFCLERDAMTISVRGIGWLTSERYGRIRSNQQQAYEAGEGPHSLSKSGLFSHPFKNFGRLDTISRMTVYAVALALQDAGIEYSPTKKQDIGIVGTNAEGPLQSDREYFKDYIASGRTLSRGNLFIYTLPSSPAGEAAIHFGFLGPMLYADAGQNSLISVLDIAAEMILAGETPVTLAGQAEAHEAVYFVLAPDAGLHGAAVCDLSNARMLAETSPDVAGMIRKFSELKK